jgi:hypothetical protein
VQRIQLQEIILEAKTMKTYSLRSGFFAGILMLCGCAQQKPQFSASMYRFTYDNVAFRIRSISSTDTTVSYNELVGENVLAIDFDQDRTIDYIALGQMNLAEAQKIYEDGLSRIAMEKRLRIKTPSVDRYVHESNGCQIEIISFRPADAHPFNEFKIIDNRSLPCPEDIIIVDKNADGTLDEVLKGSVDPEDVQSRYAEAIEAGLQKRELVKTNSAILVKEKK